MPISSADVLIRRTIRALWKERDRITDQIAALSKIGPNTRATPKGRRLKVVKGRRTRKPG